MFADSLVEDDLRVHHNAVADAVIAKADTEADRKACCLNEDDTVCHHR